MKRSVYTIILALLLIALLPVQQPVAARPVAQEVDRETPYVPGEVVVAFPQELAPRTLRARATALAGSVGATVVRQYSNMALLSFDPEINVLALAEQVTAANGSVRAQPNYIYWIPEAVETLSEPHPVEAYTLSSSNGRKVSLSWDQVSSLRTRRKVGSSYRAVPTFPREFTASPMGGAHWGWDKIQADLIWSDGKSAGYVCVLDTGVDSAHPDLSGMVVAGTDFVNNDSKPYDDNGHGTHVAGIISAKLNNTDYTAMGVSKSKILPVKVLNAQGFGTSYNIAAGITYCAKNTYVKVLNLSLGGYANDPIQYSALNTAIFGKKRLVVAAAGNDSSSVKVFPAAWADPTTPIPVAGLPSIADGVLSVGAGRAPSPYPIWVDEANLGVVDPEEIHEATACATGQANEAGATGSNYGPWVNLVAPGENIYSTTPVSYPFYLNYYFDVPSGYAFMSGSSMATAFASGAAARVWTTLTSAELGATPHFTTKQRLTGADYSNPLTLAVDASLSDPTAGYDNTARLIGSTLAMYGIPFDHDGKPETSEIIMAPFCWPKDSAPFGAGQDMSNARYLNVAKAMKRGALVSEVKDAFSGTPNKGAYVAAVSGGVTRDTAVTNSVPFVLLINLPMNNNYLLRVNKSGATTGYQTFNSGVPVQIGSSYFDDYSTVSLPTNVNMHIVLDWLNPSAGPVEGPDVEVDLDLYAVLPPASGCTDCIIGAESAWDETQAKADLDPYIAGSFFGAGTLLAPANFGGTWSPYAIHNFDGVTRTADPMREMGTPTESITLRFGASLSVSPFYKPKYTGEYQFLVTDHSPYYDWYSGQGYLDTERLDGPDKNKFYVAPILRYWSKGRILENVRLAGNCDGTKAWWKPLILNGKTGKPSQAGNTCVSGLP